MNGIRLGNLSRLLDFKDFWLHYQEKNKKAQDDSDKNDPAPTPETKSDQVKVDSSSKAPKSPPEAHLETVLTREDDNNSNVNLPVATPPPASSNVITPAVKILPTVPKEETDQNVLFSNMKIDDPCASLVFHANDGMSLTRNANVGASFVHPISHPASLPAAESGGILAHSSVVHPQPFNYMRNSWYYVDPQGAIQGIRLYRPIARPVRARQSARKLQRFVFMQVPSEIPTWQNGTTRVILT